MATRIRLTGKPGSGEKLDISFSTPFRIGREAQCEVRIDSQLVSRVHAEVTPEADGWWVRDLGSTNGLLLNGQPVEGARLSDGDRLQLGKGAPTLRVALEELDAATPSMPSPRDGVFPSRPRGEPGARPTVRLRDRRRPPARGYGAGTGEEDPTKPSALAGGEPSGTGADPSLSQVIRRYFGEESEGPAGRHTRLIRQAFVTVQRKEKRKYTGIIVAIAVLLMGAVAYGVVQRVRNSRLEARAADIFNLVKAYDVQLSDLRRAIEETGAAGLEDQLARIDSLRQGLMAQYDGYVEDLGIYRRLGSEEERLIYRTARIFGESEFAISGDFVRRVRDEIHGYWLGPGRGRFAEAIRRAEQGGYLAPIRQALTSRGVPAEFFYLALQESDLRADAVGPPTRWGRAKGMWQFIPSTAMRYGLDPGPLRDTGRRDPGDQRQDFRLASDAAARYLRDLHGVLTQASGLLVMAAYNWGEHRVAPRLESLPTPEAAFEAAFEDVPTDPNSRNYWRFLAEYGDRMPEETKDYVLKIFSAAVIGQDPRHFGFDFDSPLELSEG